MSHGFPRVENAGRDTCKEEGEGGGDITDRIERTPQPRVGRSPTTKNKRGATTTGAAVERDRTAAMPCKGVMILLGSGLHAIWHYSLANDKASEYERGHS